MRPPIDVITLDPQYLLKEVMSRLHLTERNILAMRGPKMKQSAQQELFRGILAGKTFSQSAVLCFFRHIRYRLQPRDLGPMLTDQLLQLEVLCASKRNLEFMRAAGWVNLNGSGEAHLAKREGERRANEVEGRRRGVAAARAKRLAKRAASSVPSPASQPTPTPAPAA